MLRFLGFSHNWGGSSIQLIFGCVAEGGVDRAGLLEKGHLAERWPIEKQSEQRTFS